jgi:hypothetical protein
MFRPVVVGQSSNLEIGPCGDVRQLILQWQGGWDFNPSTTDAGAGTTSGRIFLVFCLFKKNCEMNLGQNYFQIWVILSRTNQFDGTYEEVSLCVLAWLPLMLAPAVPRQVMPECLSWLSHVELTGATGAQKGLSALLSLSSSSFFFFLSSVVAAPLVIYDFLPSFEACGALNRLHELASRSYWVCMLFLPAHLVVFHIFGFD